MKNKTKGANDMKKNNLIWYDRKRLFCGLPWTFTKYGICQDRLFVETGLLNLKESEVRLYRILDVHLTRSFIQRIFGLGTIHIDSSDRDLKCFDIKNVRKSQDVKELISNAVERERREAKVSSREFMMDSHDGEEDGFDESTEDEIDE